MPLSKVQDNAADKGARTFSLDRLPNGRYNAIQIKRKGEFSAYETVVDARRAGDFVSQNAGRIVDLDTYVVGGQRRYTVVVNDNADAFNARVRSLARESSKLRAGRFGMWVKQVGGPVSVSLGGDRVFEPASVLKTLHHLVLHTRLEAGTENLNATIRSAEQGHLPGSGGERAHHRGDGRRRRPRDDGQLLEHGRHGVRAALHTRGARGASPRRSARRATQISHTFGCGTPANDTTLTDLATMIEGAANGSLLPTASVRNRFFDTMTQQSGLPTGFDDLVTEEAVAAGKPAIVGDFLANSRRNGKGGSLSDVNAAFGRMLIPFKSGGVVVPARVLLRALLQLRALQGRRRGDRRLRQGRDREVPLGDPLGDRDLVSPSEPVLGASEDLPGRELGHDLRLEARVEHDEHLVARPRSPCRPWARSRPCRAAAPR